MRLLVLVLTMALVLVVSWSDDSSTMEDVGGEPTATMMLCSSGAHLMKTHSPMIRLMSVVARARFGILLACVGADAGAD